MDTKLKAIRSQKLAGTLMVKGFVLVAMEKDIDASGRNVFFFNYTPELDKAISDYTS